MKSTFTQSALLLFLSSTTAFAQQYAGYSSQAFNKLSALQTPPPLTPTETYMRYNVNADTSHPQKSDSNSFANKSVFPRGIVSTQWSVGVVADGDFTRAISDNSVKPRTGQIGFEAVHTARIWELLHPTKVRYANVDSVLAQARNRKQLIDSLQYTKKYEPLVEALQRTVDSSKIALRNELTKVGLSQQDLTKETKAYSLLTPEQQMGLQQRKAAYDAALEKRKQLEPLLLPPRACPKMIMSFLISLGNLDDTLKGTWNKTNPTSPEVTPRGLFGSNLLVPGSAAGVGRSVSTNIIWKPFNNQPRHLSTWWLHGYMNFSNTRWAVDKVSEQLNILSVSAGGQYNIFQTQADRKTDGTRDGNDVQFSLGFDIAVRNVSGEIARNQELRNKILGTQKRGFLGVEPVALLTINSFRVTFSVPYFSDDNFIAGFTGGYPVVGFGFANVLHAASSEGSRPRAWRHHNFLGKWL